MAIVVYATVLLHLSTNVGNGKQLGYRPILDEDHNAPFRRPTNYATLIRVI